MSVLLDTPGVHAKAAAAKRQRVLACALCQQRKIKCNRQSPCNHCIRSRLDCVPATLAARRRKPAFPARELLERLHNYEHLLRQNNIPFQPWDMLSHGKGRTTHPDRSEGSDDGLPPGIEKPKKSHQVRYDADVLVICPVSNSFQGCLAFRTRKR